MSTPTSASSPRPSVSKGSGHSALAEKPDAKLYEDAAADGDTLEISDSADGLHRGLGNRQLQLVGIGASIGTGIFISIGGALYSAGPGNLLLAFIVQNIFVAMVNNSAAEMTTYMPVAGGFIRLAGKWTDEALGFAAGWNFFLHQVIVVPFEIVALSLVLSYWSDEIPVYAIVIGCIVAFALLNLFAVSIYGEAEFWLSGGKCFLFVLLFSFTFVTMVGGNPESDAFGFRNFSNPGAFREHITQGALGRFEGFLSALLVAAFTCVGPEYISMIAAESKHPRTYVKSSFKNVYWRQIVFFTGGALAVGILVPYDDPTLASFFGPNASQGTGTAGASPYVIAMGNLGIGILPHIVSALLATTLFSCGNTYSYCATRILYGMALEGRAPAFLTKCTKRGIPIYCYLVVALFSLLALLQLSASSAQVLTWLISMATSATIIHYIVISITYLRFYKACSVQGFDRNSLPYVGWFQPYCGWIGMVWMTIVVLIFGYRSFSPWSTASFFTNYTLLILFPCLYTGWKLVKKTRIVPLAEVDLVWCAPLISAYEQSLDEAPIGFWRGLWRSVSMKSKRQRFAEGNAA